MMNMNDILGAAKGITGSTNEVNSENGDTDNEGLAGLMAMAKDIDMQEIERYKSMSKMELFEELKNSEHSEAVINFIKGLIAKKGG